MNLTAFSTACLAAPAFGTCYCAPLKPDCATGLISHARFRSLRSRAYTLLPHGTTHAGFAPRFCHRFAVGLLIFTALRCRCRSKPRFLTFSRVCGLPNTVHATRCARCMTWRIPRHLCVHHRWPAPFRVPLHDYHRAAHMLRHLRCGILFSCCSRSLRTALHMHNAPGPCSTVRSVTCGARSFFRFRATRTRSFDSFLFVTTFVRVIVAAALDTYPTFVRLPLPGLPCTNNTQLRFRGHLYAPRRYYRCTPTIYATYVCVAPAVRRFTHDTA